MVLLKQPVIIIVIHIRIPRHLAHFRVAASRIPSGPFKSQGWLTLINLNLTLINLKLTLINLNLRTRMQSAICNSGRLARSRRGKRQV